MTGDEKASAQIFRIVKASNEKFLFTSSGLVLSLLLCFGAFSFPDIRPYLTSTQSELPRAMKKCPFIGWSFSRDYCPQQGHDLLGNC
jgi:hypothetical protein